MTYKFHTDPGHGWLEVNVSDLSIVGLKLSDFTGYSYHWPLHGRVYLEEDVDAGVFIDAWKVAHPDEKFPYREIQKGQWIRSLPRLPEKVTS